MMINRLSDGNKKSLRKAGSSKKFQSEKNIIAIFARKSNDVKYHELIYISDVQGIYEKNEKLLEILAEPIQTKFLEIITRPVHT